MKNKNLETFHSLPYLITYKFQKERIICVLIGIKLLSYSFEFGVNFNINFTII